MKPPLIWNFCSEPPVLTRISPSPSNASMGAWPRITPSCPSHAGTTTESASPSKIVFSGLITETFTILPALLLGFFDHIFNATAHVERLLGQVIELTGNHALE